MHVRKCLSLHVKLPKTLGSGRPCNGIKTYYKHFVLIFCIRSNKKKVSNKVMEIGGDENKGRVWFFLAEKKISKRKKERFEEVRPCL